MITVDPNLEAETIVDGFRQCIYRGDAIGKNAPEMLKRILRDGYWRRTDKHDKPFTHVQEFIEAKPLAGLGTDVETVKRIVRNDSDALDALDKELQKPKGRPPKNASNTHISSGRPTTGSRQQSLRSLRENRPDLHTKVMTGELTPHRAMVKGGLRGETITIPADPVKAAARLKKRFTGNALLTLVNELIKDIEP